MQLISGSRSPRLQLREATDPLHERLNEHPMLVGLLQPDYTLAQYCLLLRTYKGVYQALERCLLDSLARHRWSFDYRARRKLPWLLEDLAILSSSTATLVQTPVLPVPGVDNLGQLIGVLYVIEGSTLGGQLIARSLASHLALTPMTGARFFNGYGSQTGACWREFLAFSESIAGDEVQCNLALKSACETFQVFIQALDLAHDG